MNRRIAQFVLLVIAVTMVVAAIAMAGKPPKPGDTPIVATITDQSFLDSIVGKVSSQTVFVLTVDVAGAVEDYKFGSRVRYRYKVGSAPNIDPSDVSSYDYGGYESNPLIIDISDQPDGEMVLCLLGYEEILDSWGSVKKTVYQEEPTLYYWTKSTTTLVRPSFTWLEPDGTDDTPGADGTATLSWEDESADPDATIDFFFGDAFMGNLIDVVDLAPDDESDTLIWNTTGVAPGIYFVCASVWENHGSTEFWSPFPVIVESPPAAAWTWQPESVVDIGTRNWGYQVEMDGYGNAMAVGAYQDERGYMLNYSVYNGDDWSASEDFVVIGDTHGLILAPPILMSLELDKYLLVYKASSDLGGESGPVRLAGAGNNKFVAVYSSWPVDGTAPRSNLKACCYDGSMWGSISLLDNQVGEIPTDYIAFAHITRVTMSSNGTALVIWTQDDGTNLVVYGSRFDGTDWATVPTPLSYNTYGDAGTFFGGLTIDDQGNGIVTFFDTPFPDAYSVVKTHYVAGVG